MNEIKTWQTRCEDRRYTGAALTGSVVRDAMQAEIDELRAKLDVLEEQEPVAWMTQAGKLVSKFAPYGSVNDGVQYGWKPLYLAAGAVEQPAIQPIDEYRRGRTVGITEFYDALYAVDQERAAAAMNKLAPELALLHVPTSAQPLRELTDSEIDQIANDGCRNAAGGIYATSVYDFARAVLAAAGGKT